MLVARDTAIFLPNLETSPRFGRAIFSVDLKQNGAPWDAAVVVR